MFSKFPIVTEQQGQALYKKKKKREEGQITTTNNNKILQLKLWTNKVEIVTLVT